MAESVAGKTTSKLASDKTSPSKASPEELLKQAVGGLGKSPVARRPWSRDLDPNRIAVAAVALLAGAALGVLAVPRDHDGEMLARIGLELEAGRADAKRLHGEVEALAGAMTQMRETTEAVRTDGRGHAAELSKRLGRVV